MHGFFSAFFGPHTPAGSSAHTPFQERTRTGGNPPFPTVRTQQTRCASNQKEAIKINLTSLSLALCLATARSQPTDPSIAVGETPITPESFLTSQAPNAKAQADVPEILKQAQGVAPIKLWSTKALSATALGATALSATASKTQEGRSYLFQDFYGAPYAYVNQVSRNQDTNLNSMLSTYQAKAKTKAGLFEEGTKPEKQRTK